MAPLRLSVFDFGSAPCLFFLFDHENRLIARCNLLMTFLDVQRIRRDATSLAGLSERILLITWSAVSNRTPLLLYLCTAS